jgi:hypothetical protein
LERNKLIPVEMNFFSEWIYARGKGQREILDRFGNFSEISRALGCYVIIAATQCKGNPDEVIAQENFKEICHLASESNVIELKAKHQQIIPRKLKKLSVKRKDFLNSEWKSLK